MVIRPATIHDLSAINTLYHTLFSDMAQIQPKHFRAAHQNAGYLRTLLLSSGSAALLATSEDSLEDMVLGFSFLMEHRTPEYPCAVPHRYCLLMDLVVHPDHRDHGIGRALIAASKDWAKNRELEYLQLNVLSPNLGAIRLYEQEGFEAEAITMRHYLGPSFEGE